MKAGVLKTPDGKIETRWTCDIALAVLSVGDRVSHPHKQKLMLLRC